MATKTGSTKQAGPGRPVPRKPGPTPTSRRARRRILLRVGLGAGAVALVLFVLSQAGGGGGAGGSAGGSGPRFEVGSPGPGEAAPTFTLESTAGGTYDLAAAQGKTVLLYFQEGLMCQPCWDQIGDIEKDMASFKALGIDELVSVTVDPLKLLRQKVADEGISTAVLSDPKVSLGETYGANQFGMMGTSTYGHSFVLVGPDGQIRWRADYGGAPDHTMYVRVPALLKDLREGLAAAG